MSDVMIRAQQTQDHTTERNKAAWPGQDRRRPGRNPNASPELIDLMRHPASREARIQVALYDAPGFVLPDARAASLPRKPYHYVKVGVAVLGSSAAWAIAFKAMLTVWG